MMALRTEEGVSVAELLERYPGLTADQLKGYFERLSADWWSLKRGRYLLTRKGWDFHSEVTMELMNVMFSF